MKPRKISHAYQVIIKQLGGPAALARELGVGFQAVRQWRRRDSIPPAYWLAVIAVARKHRVKGVTILRFVHYETRNIRKSKPRRRAVDKSGGTANGGLVPILARGTNGPEVADDRPAC